MFDPSTNEGYENYNLVLEEWIINKVTNEKAFATQMKKIKRVEIPKELFQKYMNYQEVSFEEAERLRKKN